MVPKNQVQNNVWEERKHSSQIKEVKIEIEIDYDIGKYLQYQFMNTPEQGIKDLGYKLW